MINKMKLALAGAVIATGMVSNAAIAATEPADATVEVLAAVEVTVDADLDFGVVAASAAGGTVTIVAASAATPSASGVTYISGGAPAEFRVTQASDGEVIDLTVDNPSPLTGAGTDIVLSSLTISATDITFDSANLETVYVGGTITLGANQAAGVYTGSFDVTAEYQ
jgi:Mat/Ecp fimbriae major subunit